MAKIDHAELVGMLVRWAGAVGGVGLLVGGGYIILLYLLFESNVPAGVKLHYSLYTHVFRN